MATLVIFRCPNTWFQVDSWIAEEVSDLNKFIPVECVACADVHYVNPPTRKVLGDEEEED
jgi:hypothetical protein